MLVVFDLDDTLYPERDFVFSGFRSVDAWIYTCFGRDGFFDLASAHYERGLRRTIFNECLATIGITLDDGLIEQLVSVYRDHKPTLRLFNDAENALKALRGQHRLALISDGYLQTQENKVNALQLKDILDPIILSDTYGRDSWKPSETPYRKVMEVCGVPGGECVYIGDNPSKDFVGAKRLGWRTVQINRGNGEYANVRVSDELSAHQIITSLEELVPLL